MIRPSSFIRRKTIDITVKTVASISAVSGILVLLWILWIVFQKGFSAWNIPFFTEVPTPPGVIGGGLANAITGTVIISLIATLIGVPFGLMTGIYLAEFGTNTRLGKAVRFTITVTMGVPSIIVGLFIYTIMVLPSGHFSAYAGAAALAVIMFPIVSRTTEDMLSLVPNSLREAALAIGVPRWKATIFIVMKAARSGLLTGILLAVARISGETAPILFTAMNSQFWMNSLNEPVANLTVTIYNYAMSPYDDWQSIAWGAALLILCTVLILNIGARFFLREAKR
ncbi:MAG TPA: phosphate ABC transporter permease PstA [bacterium]|nr:phosphate ABC transporter permease PstA [bacterium]HPS29615.1 phosphate ABC transporter permease PstA [bacterium]